MIPKIIHYCWVGGAEKPQSVLYCIESWKKHCPDYEIIEWNESNYDFSKNTYMKQAYDAKKWGFVPDYARLDIIYEHGGIYLDTDVEIVKSFDSLLDCEGFFGFEDTGENSFFVACGLGFGAVKNNPTIKKLRDYYDAVSFLKPDGDLDLTPAPKHNLSVFKDIGVLTDNSFQNINDIIFYPSEYFCPKIFKTGKTTMTDNTLSIHHFSASWMDEDILKSIMHNQKICQILGDNIGHKYLLLESLIKKYGFFGALKKAFIFIYESLYSYAPLLISALRIEKNNELKSCVLLDTAIGTQNAGDHIIMQNCILGLEGLINTDNAKRVPTHKSIGKEEIATLKKSGLKILCGTNILSGHMRSYGLWKMDRDISAYKNTLLMGVGFDSNSTYFDRYSKLLFKSILNKNMLHSVRDSFSENMLKSMGIKNVINTACPTMWRLTPQFCKNIPHTKSSNVICTVTDYCRDEKADKAMLHTLTQCYDKVYLWLQGDYDLEYIKQLGFEEKLILVEGTLEAYDKILADNSLDYIGTRLHAGIRALSALHRSIIISIDNRAECISRDTGLPVLERSDIALLEGMINSSFETVIRLPIKNIEAFKAQFSK